MDKEPFVTEQLEHGEQLISELTKDGFETRAAFWAKPTDEGKWFLYLASPMVDEKGPRDAYRLVHRTLKRMPNLWIEPLEIRVLGMNDSLTEAALAAIKPKVPTDPYAIQNPKPYRGMTWYRGETFGGLSIDGAYIYPPSQQGAPA
jgi:hypothetical protein